MKRKALPDLMKGLAVVLMVQVHLMELFARQEIYDSTLGKISLFLGGPFAAPVFMAVMGYFVAASGRTTQSMVWRGMKLLMLGLALNIGLNFHLLIGIFSGNINENPWHFIFGVDILFLAGWSVIILALMRKAFKENLFPYLILMLILPAISMFLPRYTPSGDWFDYLGSMFWMKTDWSYFPVVPWLSYPLLGFSWFFIQKKDLKVINRIEKNKLAIMAISFIILAATFNYPFGVITDLPEYYHHGFFAFLWIAIFIGFLALLLEFLEMEWGNSRLMRYLKWTGREVTVMYVFQWLIIGNLATALYKTQYPIWLLFWFIGILALSSILTYFYSEIKRKYNER